MKSIKLIFIILSCVLSLGLSAQETYVLSFTNATSSGDFDILKVDFFNDSNYTRLFSIDSIQYTHPNMDGYRNTIEDFEFTKDRTQVYFIEVEGDLYRYTIATDSMEYLGDLVPETTPLFVQNYTSCFNIFFINDSILYCTGFTYGKYNINTGDFEVIRQPDNLAIAFSDYEQDLLCTRGTKHKGRYVYFSNGTYHLMQLTDLENPDSNKVLYDIPPEVGVNYTSIVSYQWGCDSAALYFKPWHFAFGNGRKWYKFDLDNGTYTYSHKSAYRGGVFKHYNATDWEDCQRIVDLDEDDSTEPDIDFLIDGLCYHSGIPLSDIDVKISNEFPLDSIVVEIQNPRAGQSLSFKAGNYNVELISPAYIRIENTGTSTNRDFENAIKDALYIDTGTKQGGDIVINVTAWYDGISGRTAKAKLKIVNPLPNAGQDIDLEYCQRDSILELTDVLDASTDNNGKFYNSLFDEINSTVDLGTFGEERINYIVENQGCRDTSQINITIHPLPVIQPVRDSTMCFGESMVIDLSDVSENILWNDGDESKTKTIQASGEYSYTVTSDFSCSITDTFEIKILPKAQSNPVEAKVCAGEVFVFMGKQYDVAGLYHDTIFNRMGCDSLIFDIQMAYFDEIPLEYNGELGFCEGENTQITITSNHNKLTINSEDFNKSIKISDPGIYKISGYDTNGCLEEIELNLTQYPSPEVTTEDLLDITYQSGIELPVQYSGNIDKYTWTPTYGLDCYDCPYPELTENQDGIYTIEVSNQYGCTDTDNLEVRFKKIEYDIPNVIYNNPYNPANGIFGVKSNTEFIYSLKIYNRWGNLIYEADDIKSNDTNAGWRPEGEVNPGVFVYMITLEEDGKKKVIAGDITVL